MPILPGGLNKTTGIGVGCAYLTAGSITRYDERIIRTAFDEGARHFDVAPQYGLGTAERVLGAALKSVRDSATITTKVGITRPSVSRKMLALRSALGPIRGLLRRRAGTAFAPARQLNFQPDYILRSVEDSLRQLQTDRIDALLLHMPQPSDINEDVIRTLTNLRQQGKALAVGLATSRENTTNILAAWPRVFDLVQFSWSVLDAPLSPDDATFRITHQSLARAFVPMREWFAADPDTCRRISALADCDLSDSIVLSRALLGAALAQNSNGIVLVASRSIERTLQNIRDGLNPVTIDLGLRLTKALEAEVHRPHSKSA